MQPPRGMKWTLTLGLDHLSQLNTATRLPRLHSTLIMAARKSGNMAEASMHLLPGSKEDPERHVECLVAMRPPDSGPLCDVRLWFIMLRSHWGE